MFATKKRRGHTLLASPLLSFSPKFYFLKGYYGKARTPKEGIYTRRSRGLEAYSSCSNSNSNFNSSSDNIMAKDREIKLLRVIRSAGENWREVLTSAPYHFSIDETEDLILFKYNQIDSDFSNQAVRQARGIILEKETWKIVCYPFNKFFNIQEKYASRLKWNTARVEEKIDGSIIKVFFYKGEWRIATNGKINAFDCPLPQADIAPEGLKTFGQLASHCLGNSFEDMNPNYTYIFEVVSPWNRIVVPYSEPDIYLLGARDNRTLEEVEPVLAGFKRPKEFPLDSIEGLMEAVKELPFDKEGYVVVDKNYDRVKVKSPAYVSAHHLVNNHIVTKKRVLDLIRENKQDDFIAIFPEYADVFREIEKEWTHMLGSLKQEELALKSLIKTHAKDRKDFAKYALLSKVPSYHFAWYDGKVKGAINFFKDMPSEKVLKFMGVKDDA